MARTMPESNTTAQTRTSRRKAGTMPLRERLQVGKQLHRRLPEIFVEEMLEAFGRHALSKAQACELRGHMRTRPMSWNGATCKHVSKGLVQLDVTAPKAQHQFRAEVQQFLHEQLRYSRTRRSSIGKVQLCATRPESPQAMWPPVSSQQPVPLRAAPWRLSPAAGGKSQSLGPL